MLGDFNIAKFDIPINIRKAFDEGKITGAYSDMFNVARRMAEEEARDHLGIELKARLYPPTGNKPRRKITDIQTEALREKDERVKYHMENMIHLLELYVQSKNRDGGE